MSYQIFVSAVRVYSVIIHILMWICLVGEPEYHSRYSDWLRAGRPRSRSSSPGRLKNFLFSTSTRPSLGPTQPQCAPEALSPGVKRLGCEAHHSSIRLHGVVLN
jgi:hypothetical protein